MGVCLLTRCRIDLDGSVGRVLGHPEHAAEQAVGQRLHFVVLLKADGLERAADGGGGLADGLPGVGVPARPRVGAFQSTEERADARRCVWPHEQIAANRVGLCATPIGAGDGAEVGRALGNGSCETSLGSQVARDQQVRRSGVLRRPVGTTGGTKHNKSTQRENVKGVEVCSRRTVRTPSAGVRCRRPRAARA